MSSCDGIMMALDEIAEECGGWAADTLIAERLGIDVRRVRSRLRTMKRQGLVVRADSTPGMGVTLWRWSDDWPDDRDPAKRIPAEEVNG